MMLSSDTRCVFTLETGMLEKIFHLRSSGVWRIAGRRSLSWARATWSQSGQIWSSRLLTRKLWLTKFRWTLHLTLHFLIDPLNAFKLTLEGDYHQARRDWAGIRDAGGPGELHEDEHLPGEQWPLVLAQIEVRMRNEIRAIIGKFLRIIFFRYTLPHRKKVSSVGEKVFWSAVREVSTFYSQLIPQRNINLRDL